MKKIILAGIFCIAATTLLKAQGAKGNLYLGTDLGSTIYHSQTTTTNTNGNIETNNTKEYTISVAPAIGVFLSDHFILGGNLSVNYDHNQSDFNDAAASSSSTTTSNSTHFDIGPIMRYYFFADKPSTTMFYLQANGTVGAGSGSTTEADNNSGTATTTSSNVSGLFVYSGGGSVGITHYITKNIGLNFGVGYLYTHTSYTDNYGDTKANVGIGNSGINLSAGFHLILP